MPPQTGERKYPLFSSSVTLAGPLILPCLPYPLPSDLIEESRRKILEMLHKAVPSDVQFEDLSDFKAWASDGLPLIQYKNFETLPDCFSIYLLCRSDKPIAVDEFFLEHIKNWLSPNKKIPLLSFYHYYFQLEAVGDAEFFIAEARLLVEDQGLHYAIRSHFFKWSQELTFFLKHPVYASDFLKIKTMASTQHPLPLFQLFVKLIEKYPRYIEKDIFNDLGCLIALTTAEFKIQRSLWCLARIVGSHYFLRKQLIRDVAAYSEKKHLSLRLFPSQLSLTFGNKTTLGIALVVHLPTKYDYFDEQHILLAAQEICPNIQALKGSSYLSQTAQNSIRSHYLEIEKTDGKPFSFQERKKLSKHLKEKLKEKVERLTPSIFMNRNEEEVMKNLFFLSREIRVKTDLPQVMITLGKQTLEHLFFTVVLVRILKEPSRSLKDLFLPFADEVQFLPEKMQIVGYLRKKHPKEANIFQLKIARSSFLRTDSSTHFYPARQHIVTLLEKALGPIRDYNGGLILQQGQALLQLKNRFPHVAAEFVENFFYSITPIEMQFILPIELLQSILQEILGYIEHIALNQGKPFHKITRNTDHAFAILRSEGPAFKEMIDRHLYPDNPSNRGYIYFSTPSQEIMFFGYLCCSFDQEKQDHFVAAINQAVQEWTRQTKIVRTLRLNFQDWPYSLDPRLGGDILSTNLLKLLYEGLTRKGKDGVLSLATAEKVTISEDLKTYTFKLRPCSWSNGDTIVAHDFEYAWKKILSPYFATPFAYLFYPIKNAQAVKEGRLSLDHVKISAIDASTLVVELEAPSSYFLELLLHPLFSPVHHQIDLKHPHWSSQYGTEYICNGPFNLRKADPQCNRYELAKNLHYWDADEIHLDEIILLKANSRLAIEMFLKNETDWLGRPTRPWEASFAQAPEPVETYNTAAIYWYVFNVEAFPFHNKHLRKAISHAIDRQQLSHLHYGAGSPSMTPLPWAHTQHRDRPVSIKNPQLAREFFNQALKELGMSSKEFPVITLIHTKDEVRDKIAQLIKIQIEEALGIRCQTEAYPWDILFDKMTKGEYQIGAMGWSAMVDNPLYTLNAFKNKHEKINFAKWENSTYQELLNAADKELNKEKRQNYLADAEAILIEEVPLIPISYEIKQYLKKKHVQLPSNSYTGEIDFKWLTVGGSQNE